MTLRFIGFNGPSGCGKDAGAKAIMQVSGYGMSVFRSFGVELKETTCRFFNAPGSWFSYENIKDKPHSDFNGLTPREAYIWMAEEVVKPKFGKYYWAEKALAYYKKEIIRSGGTAAIDNNRPMISADIGFTYELEPIVDFFKRENVLLLRIHRSGFDFKNDSRKYISDKYAMYMDYYDIENNTTLADYNKKVVGIARTFLES